MNRLFGAKSTAPKPTLEGAITGLDTRIESLDVKIAKAQKEFETFGQKMAKMKDGPGKNVYRQKAQKALQRRRMFESQKDQLEQQQHNMEQAGMMTDNLKNVMTTVDVMKQTNKSLKQQYGKIDIDKIERMQDEMADLMEMGQEIQDSISRSYEVPEDVDEAELDAELEALGDEMEMEGMYGESVPSFMTDEVPTFIDEAPNTKDKVQEPAR